MGLIEEGSKDGGAAKSGSGSSHSHVEDDQSKRLIWSGESVPLTSRLNGDQVRVAGLDELPGRQRGRPVDARGRGDGAGQLRGARDDAVVDALLQRDVRLPGKAHSVAVDIAPPASGRSLGPDRPPPEAEVGGHDEEDEDECRPHGDEYGQDRRHRELAHLGQGALPRLRLRRPAQLLAARPLSALKGIVRVHLILDSNHATPDFNNPTLR